MKRREFRRDWMADGPDPNQSSYAFWQCYGRAFWCMNNKFRSLFVCATERLVKVMKWNIFSVGIVHRFANWFVTLWEPMERVAYGIWPIFFFFAKGWGLRTSGSIHAECAILIIEIIWPHGVVFENQEYMIFFGNWNFIVLLFTFQIRFSVRKMYLLYFISLLDVCLTVFFLKIKDCNSI